jgi:diguanylate cyclase (GGDEF)-like protein/PAS domain S-box-containing protein
MKENDSSKSKEQLIDELKRLRQHIADLRKEIRKSEGEADMQPESAQLYRTLLHTVPDAITVTDLEGRIIEVSQKTAELHGFDTPEELLGSNAFKFIAPEDRDRAMKNLKKTLTEGTVKNVEYTFLKKDGTPFYAELNASLITDIHGRPEAFIATTRDITSRKIFEEEIQKSEEQFRLIFENAKDAIIWADPEIGTIINCNKAAEVLLEKTKDEIIGRHQKELHPPEKAEYYVKMFENHVAKREAVDDEAEIITKFGTTKDVHITASITAVAGRPIIQGIFHDITERKLIEKSLRESEDKYRTLVEQSLQGIIIAKGIPPSILFANTALAHILGYTTDELYALSKEGIHNLVHPDDRELFFRRYKERLEGKSAPSHYEVRAIRKDGDMRWVEIFSSRITSGGEPAVQAAFIDITAKKEAIQALLGSEQQYRSLQSNIPVGLFRTTTDPAGHLVSTNPALVKMFGYENPEDMATIRVADLYLQEDDRKKFINSLTEEGEVNNYEVQFKRKDDSVFWGSLSARAIRDDEGNYAYIDGILEDITKRKEAELAVQRSEEQLRALQSNIPVGIFRTTMDPSGHLVSTNPALAAMFGYKSTEEMNRIRVADLYLHEDDRNEFVEMLKSNSEVANYETQFKKKDDSVFWGSLSARAIRGEDGEFTYIDGTIEDITERKEYEIALEKSEEQYRTLQANIPVGLFRTTADPAGHIVSTNPALARMFGYRNPQEMETIRVADLYVNHDDRKKFIKILREKGEVSNFEVEFKKKDNSIFWGSLSARAIAYEEGKIAYIDGILEDITERKEAQAALQESEEKYRRVVDNSLVGFYIIQNSVHVFCNQRLAEMFGYEKTDEVIGKHIKDFVAPESWAAVEKQVLLRELGEMGERETLQYTFKGIKRDGTVFEIETSGNKIMYEGKPAIQGNMIDITVRKRAEEKLKILATRDALTGVLNRGVALLLFAKQLQMAKRESVKLSICYLDLDGLKEINDTYGHQEGDETLKMVSKFLLQSLREADIVCRLGGDEFLIILPHCPVEKAMNVWERISRAVVSFNGRNEKPYIISLSRGFAEFSPENPKTVDQLIAMADREMYKHKHSKSAK